ncbi:MAG: hypothetical protein ACKOBP_07910, partial [Planctomycetia bacterium]
MRRALLSIAVVFCVGSVCVQSAYGEDAVPPELVDFGPVSAAPLFAGGGPDAWDRDLRERGWIVRSGDGWHLWYTGS